MPARSKEEVVQELQKRNISFDGGASGKDLLKILKQAERRDNDVNAPGATDNSDPAPPVVQPLESVNVPAPVKKGEICWNCQAQDSKTKNRLDEDGTCPVCGFEKDKLYNGTIEADKAAQRVEAAQAAERQ